MYSDDGERVKFFNDCNLEGAVEIWLSRLLDFHCETIRNWLRVAVVAYEVRIMCVGKANRLGNLG